jgi:excisionase family DNA binding protein
MTPLAVSVPEAARLLGLSRSTTYAAVKRGDIPSVRIGGRIVVPLRRLEELINPERGNAPTGGAGASQVIPFGRAANEQIHHG